MIKVYDKQYMSAQEIGMNCSVGDFWIDRDVFIVRNIKGQVRWLINLTLFEPHWYFEVVRVQEDALVDEKPATGI